MARNSLAWAPSGSSPTSSRKTVPPCAASSRPTRRLSRAGERALLVAEELALEQRGRERRAVDAHERPLAARQLVQRLGQHLLADAGLAEDEHVDARLGDLGHQRRRRRAAAGSTTRRPSAPCCVERACACGARTTTNESLPMWKLSPSATGTATPRARRALPTRVPFFESRSSMVIGGPRRRRACRRDSVECGTTTSQSASRPMVTSSRTSANVVKMPSPATSRMPPAPLSSTPVEADCVLVARDRLERAAPRDPRSIKSVEVIRSAPFVKTTN